MDKAGKFLLGTGVLAASAILLHLVGAMPQTGLAAAVNLKAFFLFFRLILT